MNRNSTRKGCRYLWVWALVLTLPIWLLFTWPLPAHVATAVPWSAHHYKTGARVNAMEPCDQLQFLYHYWLAADMLAGKTPWFHNLYEMNFGDDAAAYRPDSYFVPFSLIHALGQWLVSQPFGMNLAGVVALWLSALFTGMLVRRYGADDFMCALAMLIALIVPYRWHTLLGGSPTGPALAMAPWIVLGLDLAVRERCGWGGALAGLGIFFACTSDTHVFFFAVLSTPFWCLLALINRPGFAWTRLSEWLKQIPPLLPAAAGLGLAMWVSTHLGAKLDDAVHSGGRELGEVHNYSPVKAGLVTWDYLPMSNLIYVGWTLPVTFMLGGLAVLLAGWRRRKEEESVGEFSASVHRPLLTVVLLGIGMLGVVLLALGTNGPPDGLWTDLARDWIPRYNMIRQTSKIYCLMPTMMALAFVLVLPFLLGRWQILIRFGGLVVVLIATWEYRTQLNPAVMILDREQGAYKAVADSARAEGKDPRALVVAFWPGDSHETALYQHYVSLYRIRMVNGYTPFVSRYFMEEVYEKFESVNQGVLTDAQIDTLLAKGIDYLLLHEDRFPEKVSPFPVGLTLRNLMRNPRVAFMTRDHEVWAFRLLKSPGAESVAVAAPERLLPARRWEAEILNSSNTIAVMDGTASKGHFSQLEHPGAWIRTPTNHLAVVADPAIWLRVRGQGEIDALWCNEDTGLTDQGSYAIESNAWNWLVVPLPAMDWYSASTFMVSHKSGRTGIDMLMLMAGAWTSTVPVGAELRFNATDMFHAGHSDLTVNEVVMDQARRAGLMLYGPKLPLDPGHYEVELFIRTEAAAGTKMGELFVSLNDEQQLAHSDVVAGERAVVQWTQPDNRPFNIVLTFTGAAELRASHVIVRRLR